MLSSLVSSRSPQYSPYSVNLLDLIRKNGANCGSRRIPNCYKLLQNFILSRLRQLPF